MQGYLFSPAKPAAEIKQLFQRERAPAAARERRQIPTSA
jgi:hypothetical protein